MAKILNVFLNQELVGKLTQDNAGKISFRYNQGWLENPKKKPLSISLPLQETKFNAKACSGFFSGLLPEDEIRRTIARNLGVSDRNDFSLLERIGGDCAGAITFFPEGQIPQNTGNYQRLTDNELANEIRKLPQQPLLAGQQHMRLSLAGAQTKLAVYVKDNAILLPLDGAPSTHILKPQNPKFENLVFNEAFCMRLAQQAGLVAATVEIRETEELSYLLIKRYDRKLIKNSDMTQRLHQEDFCQALGILPTSKYQKEGGPSLKNCFNLIRQHSSIPATDLSRLLDAVIFNYLIGNADAHGKNFSFLFDWEASFSQDFFDPNFFETNPSLKIFLAPLYDLICTIHYPQLSKEMAMKIGGEYSAEMISIKHFENLASEINFSKSAVRQRVLEFTEKLKNVLENIDFDHPSIDPIRQLIKKRCDGVLR